MARIITTKIEDLAQALLDHGGAQASQYAMDILTYPRLANLSMPKEVSYEVLVISAAMLELFAERRGEPPPAWTTEVGGVPQPGLFLMGGYEKKYPRRGERWRQESPGPLKRRNLFASAEFMTFC